MCGLHKEKDKEKKEATYKEIIETMGLTGFEKHMPSQLSGGQQQRVALARILVSKPEILMLDEPFSALDSHLREKLQLDIKKILKHFGKGAIIVTHSRDEAYRLCDNIALLDRGYLSVYKEKEQFFANPVSRQGALITGCKNIVDAKKVSTYEVEIPQWGIRLKTAKQVEDGLCAIAIRAQHFAPSVSENLFPIHFVDKIESPFADELLFKYENQPDQTQDIWWRVQKGISHKKLPTHMGIDPSNIMLLYED